MRAAGTLLIVATLAFAACGRSGDTADAGAGTQNTQKQKASSNEVVMELIAFKPETIEVTRGTTVTWRQKDAGAHTVTSGTVEQGGAGVTQRPDGRFDSGDIATGDSFRFTFDEPGTYPYFCSLHPATMRGEVRVN